MFNMDYLLCQQAECSYEAFIGLLDTVLELPLGILEQLKNIIKRLETLIVSGIVKSAEDLLNMISDCLKLPDGVNDIKEDFCEALLKCEFLYKSFLPSGTPVNDAHDWIKENICGNGIANFLNNLKSQFNIAMQGLASDIIGATGIDYIKDQIQTGINKYQEFLLTPINDYFPFFSTLWNAIPLFSGVTEADFNPETANIYDLIDFINQFAECVFAVCNLAESVTNKILDIEKKASIDIRSRRYVPLKSEIGIYRALNEAQRAIDSAQASPCLFN